MPRSLSRGGTRCSRCAAAPPSLVMPTFEPGWDAFLVGAAAYSVARAPFCRPFLISFRRRSATAVVAPTLVHSCSRVRLCRHTALVQLCTPARACANQRGQGRAFGLSLLPLRQTSSGRCPLLAELPWPSPWRFASCTRPQRRGVPSLWPFSARLATGFRPNRMCPCPAVGALLATAFGVGPSST
jgi:hypothetical protein